MRGISALRPLVRPAPVPRAAYARALQARTFSGTSIRLNEQKKEETKEDKKDEKKEKEQKKRGYDEDAGPPQSPFKVFLQVFKEEIEKNQGWQQNVKQLSGEVDKMADSKAMKAAREMYERTRVSSGLCCRLQQPNEWSPWRTAVCRCPVGTTPIRSSGSASVMHQLTSFSI